MASYETFYTGSEHSFEKSGGAFSGYHPSVRDIAYPTDPLSANQLKKVSDKISSGAQTIEVSGLGLMGGGPMKHLAAIPRQHWKEIDRLRKLTGVDLTFHGPLVESTGFSRGNWSEDQRVEAEKQMKAAVELAQQMNSDDKNKGIVMTFHSNNGLPEVEREVIIKRNPDGTIPEGGRKIVQMAVYNERTGQIGSLPAPKPDYYEKKGEIEDIRDSLNKFNKEQWTRQIESVFVNSTRANNEIAEAFIRQKEMKEIAEKNNTKFDVGFLDVYKTYKDDYETYKKAIEGYKENVPGANLLINNAMTNIQNASFFVQESYNQMKELFNEAYQDAKSGSKQEALVKLDNYAKDLRKAFKDYEESSNIVEFQKKIAEGTRLLSEESVRPNIYKPLRKFAVDKGSDTFSNVAIHAWKNAKDKGLAPGIISIENPPAGMSGLTRADEILELVKASREKFVKTAVKNKLMSENEAKKTAERIIGATWDVGHINSIQKWGYNRKDVLEQAKKIAPVVKHMHIADNLGFEDAELPAGMGNVPLGDILNPNEKWNENFRNAKKAIETGDWFSRQGGLGMTKTPVTESLSGLGASIYSEPSMGDAGASYWNDAVNPSGNYFGGLGPISPEVHHSIYQAGFSGVPAYLGGELPGKSNNSSFSGAPLD